MSLTFSFLLLIIALVGYYQWYIHVAAPLLIIQDKKQAEEGVTDEVTVVICAKNEVENIGELIACLKKQTYNFFKVFIVDDNSQDETLNVAQAAIGSDERFFIHRLNETKKRYKAKKGAIDFAYQQIETNWVLHIDADCIPASNEWIAKVMQQTANPEIQLVLGLGFFREAKKWWQHIVQGETILIAMQYIGTAIGSKPYMAVGRNMAVHKSIYKQVNFDEDLLSGDDDLLIQEYATNRNVAVAISPEARTLSTYSANYRKYLGIKKRHVSTSTFYAVGDKIKLVSWPLGLGCAWLGLLFDNQYFTFVFATLLFLRVLFQSKISKVIYGRTFIGFLLIVESYLLIQSLIVYIANLIRPKRKWN